MSFSHSTVRQQNRAIVFCLQSNYWPHTATAVRTLLENAQSPVPDIHIFYDKPHQFWIRKLKRLAASLYQPIFFHQFDMSLVEGFKTYLHLGLATYFRMYIPEILNMYDRLLYLDSDLVVCSGIHELLHVELEPGMTIAARPAWRYEWPFFNQGLQRNLDIPYFNAGVLLIDTNRWNSQKCSIELARIFNDCGELIRFGDQDVLNLYFDGHFTRLAYKWNVTRRFFEGDLHRFVNDLSELTESIEAAQAPAIIHFTSSSKPWNLLSKHPLRNKYRNSRGRFHLFPYRTLMECAEKWINFKRFVYRSALAGIQGARNSITNTIKRIIFSLSPDTHPIRSRLRPSFEVSLPHGSQAKIDDHQSGIYRLLNADGEIVYIGWGLIREGLTLAKDEFWSFETIQFSMLPDFNDQKNWFRFWIKNYQRKHNGMVPLYNKTGDIDLVFQRS